MLILSVCLGVCSEKAGAGRTVGFCAKYPSLSSPSSIGFDTGFYSHPQQGSEMPLSLQ